MSTGTVDKSAEPKYLGSSSLQVLKERNLIRAYLNGDRSAYERIFSIYGERVYNFVYRIVSNREDAADITQEAFCRLLTQVEKIDLARIVVSTYLYKTARNIAFDLIRRRKKQSRTDEIPENHAPVEVEQDPERATLQDERSQVLIDANRKLNEKHRAVLAMRELDYMSYRDIAQVLDMKENAVAQLLSRARLRLREEVRRESLMMEPRKASCKRALPLLSRKVDGEIDASDATWLDLHLDGCNNCRENLAGMEEAGISYRSWLPAPIGLAFEDIADASSVAVQASSGKVGLIQHWKFASLSKKANLALSALCLPAVVTITLSSAISESNTVRQDVIESPTPASISSVGVKISTNKKVKIDNNGKVKVVSARGEESNAEAGDEAVTTSSNRANTVAVSRSPSSGPKPSSSSGASSQKESYKPAPDFDNGSGGGGGSDGSGDGGSGGAGAPCNPNDYPGGGGPCPGL